MAYSRPFPTTPALTAITIGYVNDRLSYIADDLLPRVPVGAEKFEWLEIPIGQGVTIPNTLVGRRGRVERVEFSGVPRIDQVNDYGLEDAIPQTDIEEAAVMRSRGEGTFNPLDTATEMLTNLILLDREVRVAGVAQNPATYAAGRQVALSGSSKFSDYANSDPVAVIKAAITSALMFRSNTMAMGQAVFDVLSSHPKIVNAIKGNLTTQGIVTKEELAKLFSIEKLLVGEAYVNMARSGQLPNLVRVWGNNIVLAYVDPKARPTNGMTFGFTAQYGTRIAGTWEDKNVGLAGGQVVRTGERVKEVICAPDAGFLISNAI